MPARLLLGIDVGTTSTKAVIADAEGTLLAQASQEYSSRFPQPGWAEQDPEDWWRATCVVIRRTLADAAVDPAGIAGICISSQAPTLVAVDSAGRPLHSALLWMDRRSQAQCEWIRERVGDQAIATINGGGIDPYYLAPELLWMRENLPEMRAPDTRFLVTNGYLALRLTGVASFDCSHGPLTLLFDSAAGQWSEIILDALELDPQQLLPPTPCAAIVGGVTADAAAATGLRVGTPVLAGMVDATAAAIEARVTRPGEAVEMTGQSTVLTVCSDRPYLGRELIPLVHAEPGRWLVVGAMVATGGALRWFRDQLGESERVVAAQRGVDAFDLLSELAAGAPPGANRLIFLPYMYGERSPIWDSDARGVFCGLSLASTKADMVRAILEGAALGLRHNLEVAALAGFTAHSLACVGGGARSPLWNQIKADVLRRTVTLPRAATGAPMGDAILAAVGAGIYPNLEAAVAAMVRPGSSFAPDAARAVVYDELYRVYRSLYPALRDSFAALAAVGAQTELQAEQG